MTILVLHQAVPHILQQNCAHGNNYYQNETPKAESRTEKHWHTSPETYLLGYEVAVD